MVFTSKTRRSSASDSPRIVRLSPIPALLIRTVGSPWSLRILEATSLIATDEVMSVL